MIATYDDLKNAIAFYLDRADEETSGMVPVFIGLFEAKFNRTGQFSEMDAKLTQTPDAEGRVPLPTDMAQMRSVRAETTPKTYLRSVTPDYADSVYIYPGALPRHYYVKDGYVNVVPLTASDITISYYAKLPPLSATQATNWLLSAHPDVYLYGSLAEAFVAGRNDSEAAKYGALYKAAFDQLDASDMGTRWNAPAMMISGAAP